MRPDPERIVPTGGRCLAYDCGEPAAYLVLMRVDDLPSGRLPRGWWWPECVQHTADLRAMGHNWMKAVVDYPRG